MSVKIISYDLGSPESSSDYEELIKYIKGLGSWAKPLYSVWFVDTDKTSKQVREGAQAYMDKNDKIFVAKWNPSVGWSSSGLSDAVLKWLHARE